MVSDIKESKVFKTLRWATFFVFLGRAYQHWFWDAPFRVLLWDESWMKTIIEFVTGQNWEIFVTSESADNFINGIVNGHGILYLVFAISTVFVLKIWKAGQNYLWIGASMLIFLAFLYMKERFFSLGQFLEYTAQFSSPILLWLIIRNFTSDRLLVLMKIAIFLTFTCHGLYALGYYPIPGPFVEMTMNIFHVENQAATQFLKFAGVMDFVVAILIFVPKLGKYALLYAIAWGFLTSIARVWAHFYIQMPWDSLHQWIPEMLYRFPHFLIPLAAYFQIKEEQ